MEAKNLLHTNLAFRTFWLFEAQTIVIVQLSILKETTWNTAHVAQLPLACQWGQRLSRPCAVAVRGAETFIRSHRIWLCSVSLLLVLVFNVALLVFRLQCQSNQTKVLGSCGTSARLSFASHYALQWPIGNNYWPLHHRGNTCWSTTGRVGALHVCIYSYSVLPELSDCFCRIMNWWLLRRILKQCLTSCVVSGMSLYPPLSE